jgi:hypothetical protein
VPPLTKRDVEAILAVLSDPPADIGAEVDGLRRTLTEALAKVLGRDGSWDELVAAAGLDRSLLSADPVTARHAMWALATMLNEHRDVDTGPPSGKSQREAVSAIERAIKALVDGDSAAVQRAAAAIADLDKGRLYPELPAALIDAAAALEQGPLSTSAARPVFDALGPGPLAAELEQRLS